MKKIISITLITVLLISFVIPIYSNASDVIPDTGINADEYRGNEGNSEKTKQITSSILGIIHSIGTILSVVILMLLGIKYMLGSVEERADYKSSFKLYILGAFIIFTGTWLPQIIYEIVKDTI